MDFDVLRELIRPSETKIVFAVIDGLGGLPSLQKGLTELEAAHTPHLDALARESICGLHQPVATGITPGSGPGHLGLFGYEPLRYRVGRGVLSALGIGFDLKWEDVAARGNFCTLDDRGQVVDRRAGRISSKRNRELCDQLRNIQVEGVEVFVETVKEHRFLLVLRGEMLSGDVSDTDPQQTGKPPRDPVPLSEDARKTSDVVNRFADHARHVLAENHSANMVLLRGFSKKPEWPQMGEIFGVKPAVIAGYPMYRGLGRLIGMEVIQTGEEFDEELQSLKENWDGYDFFFIHAKPADSAGEDGDFDRKVSWIEHFDERVPQILSLKPDVLVVTGDHSTPSVMKSHSWHPVPVLLRASTCRRDPVERFSETACLAGGLGPRLPAADLMPLALAHARRLEKFGA